MTQRLCSKTCIQVLLFALLLTACGKATPTATPVSGAGEAAVAMIQQQMFSNLTQQAIDNARIQEGAKMTATQQIVDATATKSAHEEELRMTQRADSATQQAWKVTVEAAKAQDVATSQAASLHETQTLVAQGEATRGAALVATEKANSGATATADYKTQQAPIAEARAKALALEAKKAELEFNKSKDTYWLSAYGGWFFAICVLIAAGFMLWKKSQVGVISDKDGKVRIVMINQRALQPELMYQPVLDFSDKQIVTAPNLNIPAETQRQIVHETKVVEAISSLPQGYQRQALSLAGGMASGPAAAVNIQVVQPGNIQPWLDDVQGQMSAHSEEVG
jgi:hypothetical protein